MKIDEAREHKPERARRLQRCHIHPLSSSLQVCWICMGGFGRCHKHGTTLNPDRTLASTTCSRLSQSLSHWCCTLASSDSHTGCRQLQTVSQDITNDMGATTRRRSTTRDQAGLKTLCGAFNTGKGRFNLWSFRLVPKGEKKVVVGISQHLDNLGGILSLRSQTAAFNLFVGG